MKKSPSSPIQWPMSAFLSAKRLFCFSAVLSQMVPPLHLPFDRGGVCFPQATIKLWFRGSPWPSIQFWVTYGAKLIQDPQKIRTGDVFINAEPLPSLYKHGWPILTKKSGRTSQKEGFTIMWGLERVQRRGRSGFAAAYSRTTASLGAFNNVALLVPMKLQRHLPFGSTIYGAITLGNIYSYILGYLYAIYLFILPLLHPDCVRH